MGKKTYRITIIEGKEGVSIKGEVVNIGKNEMRERDANLKVNLGTWYLEKSLMTSVGEFPVSHWRKIPNCY